MFDWTAYSNDPNGVTAHIKWKAYYENIVSFKIFDRRNRDELILDIVSSAGNKILDIGFAEHTIDYVNQTDWFHKKLRSLDGKQIYGLDINKELVEKVRTSTGWENLVHADATDTGFVLQEDDKFNVIHAGDIIEHVSNIGDLLKFCHNNLRDGGILVLTTPNACSPYKVKQLFKFGILRTNFEHICWISPSNINELCRRHQFDFIESHYSVSSFRRSLFAAAFYPITYWLKDFLFKEFVFVLRARPGSERSADML